MTVVRGFAITITSGIVFAAVGAGCGVLLGAVSPDYYRTVFQVPPDIQLDATEIGFGLGEKPRVAGYWRWNGEYHLHAH